MISTLNITILNSENVPVYEDIQLEKDYYVELKTGAFIDCTRNINFMKLDKLHQALIYSGNKRVSVVLFVHKKLLYHNFYSGV